MCSQVQQQQCVFTPQQQAHQSQGVQTAAAAAAAAMAAMARPSLNWRALQLQCCHIFLILLLLLLLRWLLVQVQPDLPEAPTVLSLLTQASQSD